MRSRLQRERRQFNSNKSIITNEQIIVCWRLLFHRDPEETEVLDYQLNYRSIDAMLEAVCTSDEFVECNEDVLLAYFEANY